MADECIFCGIAEGRIPCTEISRGDDWMAFRDIDPQAPGHLLFIPFRHVETLDDLQASDADLVGRIVLAATKVARSEGLADEGYRLVWNVGRQGGQAVYHIHLHLLGGRQMSWPPG